MFCVTDRIFVKTVSGRLKEYCFSFWILRFVYMKWKLLFHVQDINVAKVYMWRPGAKSFSRLCQEEWSISSCLYIVGWCCLISHAPRLTCNTERPGQNGCHFAYKTFMWSAVIQIPLKCVPLDQSDSYSLYVFVTITNEMSSMRKLITYFWRNTFHFAVLIYLAKLNYAVF